ncbi:MAG: hypothetical protein IJ457_04000 [Clostridia bacterium]|nr:hypothetical protein [Clostridia bacterium]
MKYSPTNQNKQVSVASAVCFCTACALYIISVAGLPFSSILQFIMVALLCAGVYILIRYRFTTVTYELRAKSTHSSASYGDDIRLLPLSMVDLAVHRFQGKRGNIEFLLSLDKLREVTRLEDGTMEKLRQRYKNMRLYYYTIDLVKRERIAAVFEDEGDVYCAVLEYDEAFSGFLFDACRRNKENEDI